MPRSRSPRRKRYSRSRSSSPRHRISGGRRRRSSSPSRNRRTPRKSPRRPSGNRRLKSRSPQRRRSRSHSHSRRKPSPRHRRNSYERTPSPAKNRYPPTHSEPVKRESERFQESERARTPVDLRLKRFATINPEVDEGQLYAEDEPISQLIRNEDPLSNRASQLDDNYGIGELDYDEEPEVRNTPPPPVWREDVLLSQRFRDPDQRRDRASFKFDENITVDIRRKVKESSPEEIRRDFDPMSVLKCIHRSGEGDKPIFEREEIVYAKIAAEQEADEVVERRVVSMAPNKSSSRLYQEDFAVNREQVPEPSVSSRLLGDRWGSHIAQAMMPSQQQVVPMVQRTTDNIRYRQSDSVYASSTVDRRPENPNDLRNALMRRRKTSERERSPIFDARQKIANTRRDGGQRLTKVLSRDGGREFSRSSSHMGHDSIKVSSHRDRHDSRSQFDRSRSHQGVTQDRVNRDRSGDAKDRRGHSNSNRSDTGRRQQDGHDDIQSRMLSLANTRDNKKETPDFSKRPDKGQYESWTNDPTQTPIGAYFEHDNRDGKGSSFRGRGRGFVPRGQSFSRGFNSRGRGFRGGRGAGQRGRGSFQSSRQDSRRDSRDDRRDRDHNSRDSRESRDYRSRSSWGETEWKHDKFKELIEEEDSKISSTTKS